MKKLLLILTMLVAFGLVTGFAEVEFTVDGDATATFGYDVETGAFGFTNACSNSIKASIVPKGTVSTEAVDGWYGWIELKDFEVALDSAGGTEYVTGLTYDDTIQVGTDADGAAVYAVSGADVAKDYVTVTKPSITAKIINGPMYITIYANDGFTTGQASAVEDNDDDPVEGEDADLESDLTEAGGLTFGYGADMFSVAAHIATGTGYDDVDSATNNQFLIGLDGSVTAGPAAITLEVVKAMNIDDDELGLGAKVAAVLGPASVYVATDVQYITEAAWEVGAGVSMGLMDMVEISADVFYSEAAGADAEIGIKFSMDAISLGAGIGVYDLVSDAGEPLGWAVDVDAGYDVGEMASISVGFGYDASTTFDLSASVDLTVIPNTTFTIAYAADSLTDATTGNADFPGLAQDKGEFTIAAKIDY